jgi:MFS superfamily sulfate permease-like transporter
VPVPALPWTKWSDVGPLLVGAVGIILVSPTDTIAAATNFAFRRGDEVDSDQEMVGIGTSNIAAGFFQGFAVSVGGCRAAMVDQSGARTQLTGLVGAGLVAVLLLFLNGLLVDLPQTALASVAITAALSLMDLGVLRRYAQVRTSALTVSLVAAVGVILLGVLQGIIVAIVLAILSFFSPELVAPRHCPRRGARDGWVVRHREVPRGHPAPSGRRVPSGSATLLCQQWSVPG